VPLAALNRALRAFLEHLFDDPRGHLQLTVTPAAWLLEQVANVCLVGAPFRMVRATPNAVTARLSALGRHDESVWFTNTWGLFVSTYPLGAWAARLTETTSCLVCLGEMMCSKDAMVAAMKRIHCLPEVAGPLVQLVTEAPAFLSRLIAAAPLPETTAAAAAAAAEAAALTAAAAVAAAASCT